MESDERLRELEEKYEGYRVYDNAGERIGKVDDLFVDEQDNEEYIGVKMGFFGLRSTLIPLDVARINEHDRSIEVAESKSHVKDAPSFDDDEDITPEFEERIRSYFGLTSREGAEPRGSYGRSGAAGATGEGTRGPETGGTGIDDYGDDRELDVEGAPQGDAGSREQGGREDHGDREGFSGSGSTDTAAPGAPGTPETGGREGGRDPYREGYEEGLREAGREAARREVSGGTEGGASPDRGDQSGGGEATENTATRVWRRVRN